jgi:N-sulfoglucosamine sulfohydrolase
MSERGVLVLIADDWSPLARCYGDEVVQTPRIDAFANEAVVFDRAYCTSPSCAASRACILTGLHSHQHGQFGHSHHPFGFRTHEHIRSLPAVLNEAGALTGLVGKKHFAPQSVFPFAFEQALGGRHTTALTEAAGAFYREAADRPWMLMAASAYPHRMGGVRGSGFGIAPDDPRVPRKEQVPVPDWLPDNDRTRADLADYYGGVALFDEFVGQQLDALERSGRADSTLVILMSDHGMPFPGAKGSSFEAGVRCPLIIRRPGDKLGRRAGLVNWLDIAPTVYDWLGIAPPEPETDGKGLQSPSLTGRSLLPLLDDAAAAGFDHTFLSHTFHETNNYFPYRACITSRYKYVRCLAHEARMPLPSDLFSSPTFKSVLSGRLQMMGRRPVARMLHHDAEALFELDTDPLELNNRIACPDLAAIAADLRERTMQMRRQTADPWLKVDEQEALAQELAGGMPPWQ